MRTNFLENDVSPHLRSGMLQNIAFYLYHLLAEYQTAALPNMYFPFIL